MSTTVIHTAEVVIPIVGEPIVRGAVAVDASTISAVGPLDRVASEYPSVEVIEWEGVMTPGLVNAHTHLQYTTFDKVGAHRYPDYVSWAVRFVEEYERRIGEDWAGASRSGVELGLAAGVSCIADVVTDWEARDVLFEMGLSGVAYLELIGTDHETWVGGVRDQLIDLVTSAPTTDSISIGISPHAPYSVDERVIADIAVTARAMGLRTHIHVGEVDTEDDLYRTGTGAWAERVRQVSSRRLRLLESGGAGMGTAEFVRSLGLLGADCHIAHGIYLDRNGRAILRDAGTVTALCPRSNLAVGLDPPPVADFLREGVPIAVGTDSLGSSPSLDPMEDVALLRRLATEGGYSGDDLDKRLLAAATIGGARALGLETVVGSIEMGKRADLAIFDVDPAKEAPETAMVMSGGSRCSATIIGGAIRWNRSSR